MTASQPGLQPGVSVPLGESGVTFSVWGNYNIGSTTAKEFTELDGTLDYSFSAVGIDYSLGYTYYTFPNLSGAAAKTGEFYAGASLPNLPFGPGLTVYYDHDQGAGTYAALSGGKDLGSVSAGLTIGYNAGQWGAKSGTTDTTISLSKEFRAGSVVLTPSANYVLISDSSVNTNSSEFWFGVDIAGVVL